MNALIFAIVAPFLWALMNVLDKYVVSRRAKNSFSYGVLAGLAETVLGIIVGLFLTWQGIDLGGVGWAVLAGVFVGLQSYSYLVMLRTEDCSHIVGMIYVYPILVALCSYLFFGEKLVGWSYLGIVLTVIGAMMLSAHWKDFKGKFIWLALLLLVTVTISELMMKLAADRITEFQGLSISMIAMGLTTATLLLAMPSVRKAMRADLNLIALVIPIELSTLLAAGVTYYAMAGLPVAVVSSIGAAQPLGVLLLEIIFRRWIPVKHSLRGKIVPLLLIVAGVALLYATQ